MSSALLYTTTDSVKVRLAGKVQFESADGYREGELPNALLAQLIQDAETEVENQLRGRYYIPFQSRQGMPYGNLPDHTKRAIRMAVDMQAVMFVLSTDFGRGTHISGSEYYESLQTSFEKHIGLLLGRDMEAASAPIDRYRRTPPLEGLRLATGNTEADDGVKGSIINTDASLDSTSFAENQMSDPSRSYYVGRLRF